MHRNAYRTVIVAALLLAVGIFSAEGQSKMDKWARPIKSYQLNNLFQLDAKVYRSAQPDAKGFQDLQSRGIKNVLSFRDSHSDANGARGTSLKLYRIQMEAGEIKTAQVVEALRIIKNADGPIVIHCWHGADRTGLISALYRIVFQGWTKEEAIDELMHGGFGYHPIYKSGPEYIEKANIDTIKKQVMAK